MSHGKNQCVHVYVGICKSAYSCKNLPRTELGPILTYIIFISLGACGYVQIHFSERMNSFESGQLVNF